MKADKFVGKKIGKLTVTGFVKITEEAERYHLRTLCECGTESDIDLRRIDPNAAEIEGKNKMRGCERCMRTGYKAEVQIASDSTVIFGGLKQPPSEEQQRFTIDNWNLIKKFYPDFIPAVMFAKNKSPIKAGTMIGASEVIGFSDQNGDEMMAMIKCSECGEVFEVQLETLRTKLKANKPYNCRSHRIQSVSRK